MGVIGKRFLFCYLVVVGKANEMHFYHWNICIFNNTPPPNPIAVNQQVMQHW